MAHFCKMSGNAVVEVIVVNNADLNNEPFPQSEPIGVNFCKSLFGQDTEWLQTSYNGNFRKRYAGIGYTYDAVNDAFIAPQPFPSWTLNQTELDWEPPVPYPNDGNMYVWDEDSLQWSLVS